MPNRCSRIKQIKYCRPIKIFIVVTFLILCTAILSACGADSPLVYILGKDIPNFVDKTKDQKEPATLSGEYLFLYMEESDRYSKKPGKDKDRVLLKNSSTGQVDTIFEGNMPIVRNYGFILPEVHKVLFTTEGEIGSKDSSVTYICVYDYQKHELLLKVVAMDERKYPSERYTYSGGSLLSNVILCAHNTSICTRIKYDKKGVDHYLFDYHIIDINTGVRKEIDEETFRKLKAESEMENAVRYESSRHGKKIKLFSVYQYHDRIRENPKPKYNGIYINDGKNNIRISRIDGYELLKSKPIWVDDDRKVIIGKYLVDIEGKQKTSVLTDKGMADAQLLYAVPISK